MAIDHRHGIADGDTVESRADHAHPADAPQQIIAAQRGMTGRNAAKFIAGENALHLAAHSFVKAVALLAERVVDQQKAAVGEKTAQVVDFLLSERLEFVFAGEIEEGIIEQVPIDQCDFVTRGGGFHAGARHQLLHQRRDRQRMGIPVAAAILDLGEDKLQPAFLVRHGRARRRPPARSAERQAGYKNNVWMNLRRFIAIRRLKVKSSKIRLTIQKIVSFIF